MCGSNPEVYGWHVAVVMRDRLASKSLADPPLAARHKVAALTKTDRQKLVNPTWFMAKLFAQHKVSSKVSRLSDS